MTQIQRVIATNATLNDSEPNDLRTSDFAQFVKKTTTSERLMTVKKNTQEEPGTNLVELIIPTPAPITDGAEMVAKVQSMQVTDVNSYELVAMVRHSAKARHKAVDTQRTELKAPSLEAGRRIDAFFNPVLLALNEAAEIATKKLQAYDKEQRELAEKQRKEAEEAAKKERERTQMAMQEINGIQQQVMIAQMGRSGVRKGGSLQCIQDTLKETEAWPIDATRFGVLAGSAQAAKDNAIASIKAIEKTFLANQEAARVAKEQADAKAAGDQERIKAAEEDAAKAHAEKVEAKKQEIIATRRLEQQQASTTAVVAESNQRASELEYAATETRAVVHQVAGLSKAKVWKWKMLDKSKLDPNFLLVDEKAISKLVIGMNERAHAVVGKGAIEIYQEEQLRQR